LILKLSSPLLRCYLSMFSFVGYMIEHVESRVLSEMDAMESIVLSTCNACYTIQLLRHMLSPPTFSTPTASH